MSPPPSSTPWEQKWIERIRLKRGLERYPTCYHARFHGQWLAQKPVGNAVCVSGAGKPQETSSGGLIVACSQISVAATKGYPARIFGWDAASTMCKRLDLQTTHVNAERNLKHNLNRLVHEAAQLIEEEFATRTVLTEKGIKLTYRRAHFDARDDYFTYLPLDETDVPWVDNEPFQTPAPLPEVSLEPASDEKVRLLGTLATEKATERDSKHD